MLDYRGEVVYLSALSSTSGRYNMKISMANIQRLTAEIVSIIDADKIDIDLSFAEAGLDSLDTFTLFLKIEENYGFSIPDIDVNKIKTFQDLLNYSNNRLLENA